MENQTFKRDFSRIDTSTLDAKGLDDLNDFEQTQFALQGDYLSDEAISKFMASEEYSESLSSCPNGIKSAPVSDKEKAAAMILNNRRKSMMNGAYFEPDWSIYFKAPLLVRQAQV